MIKKHLVTLAALLIAPGSAFAGFDWGGGGECSGSGSFWQQISQGSVVTVGEIPVGKEGVVISLQSTEDVDIQLFDKTTGDKLVQWPDGMLNGATAESTTYNGLEIAYSGYNGDGSGLGNEYIRFTGTTNRVLEMKAYGYTAGYATVDYAWTGTEGCSSGPAASGAGSFEQYIEKDAVVEVGELVSGLSNVYVALLSDEDVDIQLVDKSTGTKIVHWPSGLLKGATAESTTYNGITIEYSGYNGDGDGLGHEYIKITGTLDRTYVLSAYGYAAGNATVNYSWGEEASSSSSASTTGEHLNSNIISNGTCAMNVYFNKSADTSLATSGNAANYNVNLETRLLNRINAATSTIDISTYEINLPNIVNALIARAAAGVRVRMVADAKDASDEDYIERYSIMRLYIEKLRRGADGTVGTADDVNVIADSPMFAVTDATMRFLYGLPSGYTDFPSRTVTIGTKSESGYMIVDGEQKGADSYYSPDAQMHNKYVIIDGTWVQAGSWNYTITGLYGSEEDMAAGNLKGNQQHVVIINHTGVAAMYTTEFETMWGGSSDTPVPSNAAFHGRKFSSRHPDHIVDVCGTTVEIRFSTKDDALSRLQELIRTEADSSAHFTIFAFSDQTMTDELKYKWEGSYVADVGTLTGFEVQGVFDASFWSQYWSASVDMTGTVKEGSTNNPNTRWNNAAPVYRSNEDRKLHAKTMIIDGSNTASDPTVIVGSTNWSNNGDNVNDENLLIIHNAAIANQFEQEFAARYHSAQQ